MQRRVFLRALAGAGAWAVFSGHTPYRQWTVYRQRYLLILTSQTDAPTYPLGTKVAELLAARLPSSEARVARAPHVERIASLVSSKQMDVAILSPRDAEKLSAGNQPFADYGPIALRVIVALGDHLLVCRDDFPDAHAYLVARALVTHRRTLPVAVRLKSVGSLPLHPGARAYAEGSAPPSEPAWESGVQKADVSQDHHPP